MLRLTKLGYENQWEDWKKCPKKIHQKERKKFRKFSLFFQKDYKKLLKLKPGKEFYLKWGGESKNCFEIKPKNRKGKTKLNFF